MRTSRFTKIADIIFHRSPGPFLVGLAWGMGLAGWMFARLLLIPIWRALYKQEAAEIQASKNGLTSPSPR